MLHKVAVQVQAGLVKEGEAAALDSEVHPLADARGEAVVIAQPRKGDVTEEYLRVRLVVHGLDGKNTVMGEPYTMAVILPGEGMAVAHAHAAVGSPPEMYDDILILSRMTREVTPEGAEVETTIVVSVTRYIPAAVMVYLSGRSEEAV